MCSFSSRKRGGGEFILLGAFNLVVVVGMLLVFTVMFGHGS
jgi:hypothetical protein